MSSSDADGPQARDVVDRRGQRAWPFVFVLTGVIALQVLLAVVSIDVLSSVRAYVNGESLYSKGQKDAQLYLLAYAQSHRQQDYQLFLQALEAPIGDRRAREALQKNPPDLDGARRGFIEGGNDTADIDGLIRLFRWFHGLPFMAGPIRAWTEGDRVIEQMVTMVENARREIDAGDVQGVAVRELREQAPRLNQRLSELERAFSAQLGDASRQTERVLLLANLGLALGLALVSLGFMRQNLRARAIAEDELRRRRLMLQLLLDSTEEGLYGVDSEGRCTFINRSALGMLGYERESDVLGHLIHDKIHHSHADGSAYAAADCRMYRAFRDAGPVHVDDEVFWRRDGTSFAVEYWSHPLLQDGEVRGAVATFFDITERLRTQSALRESEQRLSRLVDTVADGVISVDAAERIVLFNRAAERMFGVPSSQALGSTIERFIPEPHRERHHELVRQFARGTADVRLLRGGLHDLTGLRANGEVFPMEASLSKLEGDQGLLMTVVLRDVSDREAMREERRARESLEASNKAKTEFLSRMSHELRTPLNAVLGFAQLLRMDRHPGLSPPQMARVQHIEHAGAHLLALVNDVLDLSRVESGGMSLSLEPVDLCAVADEALVLVRSMAVESRITIRREHSGGWAGTGEPWVVADRVRLRQVLVNLLSNAVKYNRPGGLVTLDCVEQAGDAVECIVVDDGLGMTPEQLEHLFQPFNRLGAERTAVEGTGIGLVLSRHLVSLMDGKLSIDSSLGLGTRATVQLRRADRSVAQVPRSFAPSAHGELGDVVDVLYAEDNAVNVEIVREVVALRPAVRLRVASSGAEAIAMARMNAPDLMLVDMHLGDMTGLELARALRDRPETVATRLVALSADALPDQINAALEMGFEAYLTKPVVFQELLRVLDNVGAG